MNAQGAPGPRPSWHLLGQALGFALWALAALALIGGIALADLDAATRAALQRAASAQWLALLALMLLPALAALGWWRVRELARLRAQAARVAEGVTLIADANAAHRLAEPGTPELDAIARAVNGLAQQRTRLLGDARASLERASARETDERDRLAALISELEQGVLVCKLDGCILLYNAAAVALLERGREPGVALAAGARAVGLGRSAYALVERDLVAHAIETIEGQAARGEREGAQFVATVAQARLLRVNVAPVRGAPASGAQAARPITGLVLLLTDVTEDVERDARSIALFQDLVEAARSAIANIRAAIETTIAHPELDPAQRAGFAAIVQAEAVGLSARLDTLTADVTARLRQRWPLEPMRGADLLALAARRIERRVGLAIACDPVDAALWLCLDSFSMVQALTALAARLHEEFAVRDVRLRLAAADGQAHLDLAWQGVPMSSETAFNWQSDAYTLGGETNPLSLAQVLERHGGEAWYQRDTPTQTNYFRLRLPRAPQAAPTAAWRADARHAARFDFDLFERTPAHDTLDERRLDELAYTAFDTETTGLEPDRGDEIIAIGAVRIVNGRLLASEAFDTLVDPRRAVAPAAIAVHGITAERLAGQPTIEQVLPRFWRFAEGTVLVGHNAAFDMRFLQLKEAPAGVRFAQPVLDTLLLSAVANPSQSEHSLEAIAARLGVAVVGRHTALGDAQTTAQVFLRLLPLLAAQDIQTLGDARAAAQRSYYARLKY